jgi:hypothetical protein
MAFWHEESGARVLFVNFLADLLYYNGIDKVAEIPACCTLNRAAKPTV